MTALERAIAALDPGVLTRARWFAGKDRRVDRIVLVDAVAVPDGDGAALAVTDVVQGDRVERYLLPGRLDAEGRWCEAEPLDPLWPALAALLARGTTLEGHRGSFVAIAGAAEPVTGGARPLSVDQSNTSIVLDDRLVLKCYRRLEAGIHPEPELLAGLAAVGSERVARFGGALVRTEEGREETLVCAYAFVPGEPVDWETLIEEVRLALAAADTEALDALARMAASFGRAAGALHRDLVAAFGVEPASAARADEAVAAGLERLDRAVAVAPPETALLLAAARPAMTRALGDLRLLEGTPLVRCHGDLHVAQLVRAPHGVVVIDLEGEPGRPLAERRRPGSPLRDLACLLLSLDHVAIAAARALGLGPALDAALAWSGTARVATTTAYAEAAADAGLTVEPRLLLAWELEKELHEVLYAATVLPEWSYAPRLALGALLARSGAAT